jgi:hypothetical protein
VPYARDRARVSALSSQPCQQAFKRAPTTTRRRKPLPAAHFPPPLTLSRQLCSDIPASNLHPIPIHRVRRNRQRLPSSLLIENASAPTSSSTLLSCAEAFPIKASDKPSTWVCKRCGVRRNLSGMQAARRGYGLDLLRNEYLIRAITVARWRTQRTPDCAVHLSSD